MVALALIRHGPTAWNAEKRLQGQRDIPLSPEGEAAVAAMRLPPGLADRRLLSSPLGRAHKTAVMLFGREPDGFDDRLKELSWGDWEGRTMAEMRAEDAAKVAALEAQGVDFRAPGGESPRDVQARTATLFAEIAGAGVPTVCLCHRALIRAVMAQACGWDMTGPAPHDIENGCVHLFRLAADGAPALLRMNHPLDGSPLPAEAAG